MLKRGAIGIGSVPNKHNIPGARSANGFFEQLVTDEGFIVKDSAALKEVFEEGTDSKPHGVDVVNILYFAGHGDTLGPYFSGGQAHPADMTLGNDKLRWVIFDSCEVLFVPALGKTPEPQMKADSFHERAHAGLQGEDPVFKGLRWALGFSTLSRPHRNRGYYFARYLKEGLRVDDAWRRACQETTSTGQRWSYIRAVDDPNSTAGDSLTSLRAACETPDEGSVPNPKSLDCLDGVS